MMEALSEALGFAEVSRAMFRGAFERDGYLAPVSFLWIRADPETGEVLAETQMAIVGLDVENKEWTFQTLREMAQVGQALLIVSAYEATCVVATTPEEKESVLAWRREKGTLEGHPAQRGIVSVLMEHQPSGKAQLWEARVRRNWDKVTLDDWVTEGVMPLHELEGQAANILAPDPARVC